MKLSFSFALSFFFLFLFNDSFAQSPDFSYTQTCYGKQTTLVASSSLPDSAVSQWQWDLDGNGSYELSGKTILTFFIQNDTVAVKLKVTPVNGTADSITKNVIVDPLPQVNFIANNLCESHSAVYASQSSIASGSITQFLWDFNNDGVPDDNSNDTVSYVCGPAQTYITKLTCVSDKGCSAFSQKTTTVHPNPVASFSSGLACNGSPVLFTNTSIITNPDYFSWNFGDGTTAIGTPTVSHTFPGGGNHTVQLIAVSVQGCRDTSSLVVAVNQPPSCLIEFSGDTQFFQGSSVIMTIGCGGGSTYLWNTGSTTDTIVVTQSGAFVCIVTDPNGCTSAYSATTTVHEVPDTVSVTGFILTPNDDNINDALIINNVDAYSNCDLKVYNIWNDEMFSVKGYKNDWKGTNASGETLPAGAYYYMIQCDDKALLKGNINILR